MNKKQVIKELEIDDKVLDLLEYDFLKIHKEYIDKVSKTNEYPMWYVQALKEWKDKKGF